MLNIMGFSMGTW